jgi:hypothetical protein
MQCRRCGKEERASEGYPCSGCGTFVCIICTFRGHSLCLECERREAARVAPAPAPLPRPAPSSPDPSRRL